MKNWLFRRVVKEWKMLSLVIRMGRAFQLSPMLVLMLLPVRKILEPGKNGYEEGPTVFLGSVF